MRSELKRSLLEHDSLELSSIHIESKEPIVEETVVPVIFQKDIKEELAKMKQIEEELEKHIVHYGDPAAQSCRTNLHTSLFRYLLFTGCVLEIAAASLVGRQKGENHDDNALGGVLALSGGVSLTLASILKLDAFCDRQHNRSSGYFNARSEKVIPLSEDLKREVSSLLPDVGDLTQGRAIRAASKALREKRQDKKTLDKFLLQKSFFKKVVEPLRVSEPTNLFHQLDPNNHRLILDYL